MAYLQLQMQSLLVNTQFLDLYSSILKTLIKKDVPAMNKYVEMFMSENMIGPDGILSEIGLISLPDAQREEIRKSVTMGKKNLL